MATSSEKAQLEIILKAVDEASPVLGSIASAVGSLGGPLGALEDLGKVAFGVFVAGASAAAIAIADMTNQAANFEQRMSGVSAVLGVGQQELAKLSAEALELGRITKFTSLDAADAMEVLAKQGVSYKDIMGGAARATLDLAVATDTDLTTAASLAASAINVFNLRGEDMARVADVMAGAANRSSITATDLRFALQQGGAAAEQLGLGLEDAITSIALFGQHGIRGERAGTGLRMMLLNLIPETKRQTEMFEELGFITKDGANQFFDATGKVKGMSEIAGLLKEKLVGLNKEQQTAALQTMFGARAMQFASIMADEGAAGYDRFKATVKDVSAQDIATQRMDNLKGSIERMSGEFEVARTVIGTAFIPQLRGVVDWVEATVHGAQPLIEFLASQLPGALETAKGWLLDLIGIDTSALGDIFKPLTDAIETLKTQDPKAALDAITGGAEARKMKVLVDLDTAPAATKWETLRTAIRATAVNLIGEEGTQQFEGLIEAAKKLWQDLEPVRKMFLDIASAVAEFVINNPETVFWNLVAVVGVLTVAFTLFALSLLAPLVPFILIGVAIAAVIAVFALLYTKGQEIGKWLSEQIPGWVATASKAWDDLVGAVSKAVDDQLAALGKWWEDTQAAWSTGWEDLGTETVTGAASILLSVVTWLAELLASFNKWWEDTKAAWNTGWENLKTEAVAKAGEILANLITWFAETLAALNKWWDDTKAAWNTGWEDLKTKAVEKANEILANLIAWLAEQLASLDRWWTDLQASWSKGWQDVKDIAWNKVEEIKTDILNKFTEIRNTIDDKVREAKERIAYWIGEARKFIENFDIKTAAEKLGKSLLEGIWKGIEDSASWLYEQITKFFGSIIEMALKSIGGHSPAKKMYPVGLSFVQGFAVGIKNNAGIARDAAAQMAVGAIEAARGVLEAGSGGSPDGGPLKAIGPKMNQTTRQGRGGFRFSSGRNFWDQWSKFHGLPNPSTEIGVGEGQPKPFDPVAALGEKAALAAAALDDLAKKTVEASKGGARDLGRPPGPPVIRPPGGVGPNGGVLIQNTINTTLQMDRVILGRLMQELAPQIAWQADYWMLS